MKIVIGHSNIDLDCIGSMILLRALDPDKKLVRSNLLHPNARHLYNIYQNDLDMLLPKDLINEQISHIDIVDTQDERRLEEYFPFLNNYSMIPKNVYDHHPADSRRIDNCRYTLYDYGANTTGLTLQVIKQRISLSEIEATIALTAIYADTGNFTYDTVKNSDFIAASFLIEQNANLKLANTFIKGIQVKKDFDIMHLLLNNLSRHSVNGHDICLCFINLKKQVAGLNTAVENIFKFENCDIIFAVFFIENNGNTVIIARCRSEIVNLNEMLNPLGGGGHSKAASVTLKKVSEKDIRDIINDIINDITPAVTVELIMTSPAISIEQDIPLMHASRILEKIDRSGAPVLNEQQELSGFLSLRDISKARKNEHIRQPVKSYMAKKVITIERNATINEVEQLMFSHNIGHLPVIEGKKVIGIITRGDYLEYKKNEIQALHLAVTQKKEIKGC